MDLWLNLIPVPVALGIVLYVNYRVEKHVQSCPMKEQMEELNKKLDIILSHLLNKR